VLGEIGDIASRGEDLVAKKPALSGLLGSVYTAWGERLGEPESFTKFIQSARCYAKLLQQIAASPTATKEHIAEFRDMYIEACKRASIEPELAVGAALPEGS
jgi:hypothetical protein